VNVVHVSSRGAWLTPPEPIRRAASQRLHRPQGSHCVKKCHVNLFARPNSMVTIKTRPMKIMGAARATKTGIVWDTASILIFSALPCTETVPDVTANPAMQNNSMTNNQNRMSKLAVVLPQ
jgi:hypothetical protein